MSARVLLIACAFLLTHAADAQSIATSVGGEWTPRSEVTDLGEIPAAEAAAWFLDLAASTGVRIARTHRDPEVVAAAFFWLAEAPDDRALALFEEVLSNTGD